jgi:hypothetical protein
MQDETRMMDLSGDLSDGRAPGIDNLLYSVDARVFRVLLISL